MHHAPATARAPRVCTLVPFISIAALFYPFFFESVQTTFYIERSTAANFIIVITLVLMLADFVVCTVHIARRRFWHMCCTTSPEEQPLLGGPRSSIAGWWVKYSDIPRFLLSEALFIAIYYSTLSFWLGNIPAMIALSFLLLTIIVQFIVLISVLHSTCTSEMFRLPYRCVDTPWDHYKHYIAAMLHLLAFLFLFLHSSNCLPLKGAH